jgi:uncharacterized protein YfiM (DUF2279 family)
MENKKLYHQKKQAQLDEWKAKVDVLKAKASQMSSDVQLQMNEHIEILERKTEQATEKLSVLKNAGEDAWGSIKEGIDSAWGSIKSSVKDLTKKFN